jgi:two-component system response regulator PilR (NtrC family)
VSEQARILVVDDEQSMREFLEIFFRREGFDVVTTGDVDAALVAVEADDFDVLISDIKMPGRSGLDLLQVVKEISPETVVIMITAFATTETAILTLENRRLRSELRTQLKNRSLVGTSAAMQKVYDLIGQVAGTKTNVLISGDSGTGKELVARAIHDQSERRDRAFVAVNCGAIPENLLESELFGHVKGAFTGAVQNKAGLFEMADAGTLFLDEVGELPPLLQVKLLRVIQDKTVRRVGGTGDHRVDVRIVAATNRKLEEEISSGRFRDDLYYRLNVIQIALPALRERMEDVPLLMQHFIEKYAAEAGKEVHGISDAATECILAYDFPGNVRELENTVERAVALCRDGAIELETLPPTILDPKRDETESRLPPEGGNLEEMVNDFERSLLGEALERCGGVKKKAAALLGISFRSFRYRFEKLGLDDQPASGDG